MEMTQPLQPTEATDRELLRRADRDPSAFRAVYDRHAARIHGFHLRRTRDAGAAFELTAETFAEAWLSRTRFSDPGDGSAAPWLFGIARNVLASSVRHQAVERRGIERLVLHLEPATVTVDGAWLEGLDDDLGTALAELPGGQRRAIELRVIADQAYDDVGRLLEISPGAARVRVHRGLAAIRHRLTGAVPDIETAAGIATGTDRMIEPSEGASP
jgi:RNA polymerase sigma factor (sigma-70 family)